jgi:hypothetical protein
VPGAFLVSVSASDADVKPAGYGFCAVVSSGEKPKDPNNIWGSKTWCSVINLPIQELV